MDKKKIFSQVILLFIINKKTSLLKIYNTIKSTLQIFNLSLSIEFNNTKFKFKIKYDIYNKKIVLQNETLKIFTP